MRGVRMHCEQSSVGKVSLSWLMWPPMEASFSTRMTSWPPSAMSRAAWMPAMPPPITMARFVTGILMGSSGRLCLTFSTMVRAMSMALAVASALSSWIQEQCSRMLAISHMNGLSPARLAGRAEGLLVHVRRAGRDDDAGELVLLDGLAHQLLARVGAHVLVVLRRRRRRDASAAPRRRPRSRRCGRCSRRSGRRRRRCGSCVTARRRAAASAAARAAAFAAALAAASSLTFCSAAARAAACSTRRRMNGSVSTKWRSRPSSAAGRPKARPTTCVTNSTGIGSSPRSIIAFWRRSRLQWHSGQATTMASAPWARASSMIGRPSRTTEAVRLTLKRAAAALDLHVPVDGVGAAGVDDLVHRDGAARGRRSRRPRRAAPAGSRSRRPS